MLKKIHSLVLILITDNPNTYEAFSIKITRFLTLSYLDT
jgi:hypothetical protein